MAICKKCNKEKGQLGKSKSSSEHIYNGWCEDCIRKGARQTSSNQRQTFMGIIKRLFS